MYQKMEIIGNIGRDAELTYTSQGVAICKFTVAVNKRWGKGEDRREKTTWFRVTLWRERAESLHSYIKKGDKIFVTGEIDLSVYLDKKSNQPGGSLELTADQVVFLGESSGNRQSNGSAAATEPDLEAEESGDIPF